MEMDTNVGKRNASFGFESDVLKYLSEVTNKYKKKNVYSLHGTCRKLGWRDNVCVFLQLINLKTGMMSSKKSTGDLKLAYLKNKKKHIFFFTSKIINKVSLMTKIFENFSSTHTQQLLKLKNKWTCEERTYMIKDIDPNVSRKPRLAYIKEVHLFSKQSAL